MAIASQTFIIKNLTLVSHLPYSGARGSPFVSHSSPKSRNSYNSHNRTLFCKKPSKPYMLACSSKITPSWSPLTCSTRPPLTESTRPVPVNPPRQSPTESIGKLGTLVATAILISKLFGHAIANYVQSVCKMPNSDQFLTIQGFRENIICTSPLFFAAVKIHRQQLLTPWTIMASGFAKCIEVYMAVLAIRCALSFFPNIEWNRQPYSGLRDVSDPFLLFFQSIIPPVFDSLDVSVSVGFMVLTVLVEILTSRPF